MQFRYPDIVTEKQFNDLKKKQRAALLKEKQTLGWVLAEEVGDEECCADDRLEGMPEEQTQLVADYRKACAKFQGFIKKGKLAVTRKKEALPLLERIIHKATDKDILGFIDQAISEEPKNKPNTKELLLEKCTVTTKALYDLGLLNWVTWVDEYKHNLEGSAPYHVAVIQNPSPASVDKNGYYIKSPCLVDSPLLDPELQLQEKLELSLKEVFTIAQARLRRLMSQFQFYLCLSQVLTEETGIPFSEKPDTWHETMKELWKNYETYLESTMIINKKAKQTLESVQGMIDLEDFEVALFLKEKFREDLTSENARYWVNTCMQIYYEHECEKAQSADTGDSGVEHKTGVTA